ncbi:lactococcin 972 family bacteriocin [Bacillus sp. CDB3]|uniref:lactococcin 972 family bacteriocin n=1 Tax=Bacillus sp. CDB3 TaxID=360310 RepID=UPI0009D8C2A2|nr:lactococcin 972 family bacteriocin [Bacillus sp. CDB3]OQR53476.1 hypothetical protein CDB3_29530 [Bacillus sp. CDB3]
MLGKGILSLGLCGAILASPVTSFAAEEHTLSVQPKMMYTEFGYTDVENGEQPVIGGEQTAMKDEHSRVKRWAPKTGQCFDNVDGGTWCKGQTMGWKGDLAQYSKYDHDSRDHKASAMANGETNYGKWRDPGETAYTESPYFHSLNTYKSYYDVR